MQKPAVSVHEIIKTYHKFASSGSIASALNLLKTQERTPIRILDRIHLDVYPSEILGLIGRNGSGKSTLLKIISGVTEADSGSVDIHCKIVSLLELGAGFELELSGRDNIFLYGAFLGMSDSRLHERYTQIVDFSGISDFMDKSLKTYSTGMLIRLAFSIAVHSDPELLLLDEIFGVGDMEFQKRCFERLRRLIETGVAIILVSHDMSVISNFCSRAICLDKGKIVREGPAGEIADWYVESCCQETGAVQIRQSDTAFRFQKGFIHLTHKGEPLTVVDGVHFVIRMHDCAFSSGEAEWTLIEQSPVSILAFGRFAFSSLEISLRMTSTQQTELTIEICCESSADSIDVIELRASASSRYTNFHTPSLHSKFPAIQIEAILFESMLMQLGARSFLAISTDSETPALVFLNLQTESTLYSQIYNGHGFFRGRLLNHLIKPHPSQTIRAVVRILDKPEFERFLLKNTEVYALNSGTLRLEFEDGALRIRHEGVEVSAGVGFFHWVLNETPAIPRVKWELIESSARLRLHAQDLDRPVVCRWTFEPGGESFQWEFMVEILDEDCCIEISPALLLIPEHTNRIGDPVGPVSRIGEWNAFSLTSQTIRTAGPGIYGPLNGMIGQNRTNR